MWAIVKWKRWDIKEDSWDIFYNSVPCSWLKDRKTSFAKLMWPKVAKCTIEKFRKSGAPFSGETEEIDCKILVDNIDSFKEAIRLEIKLYKDEEDKADLTTDAEDMEDMINAQPMLENDLHEMMKDIIVSEQNQPKDEEKISPSQSTASVEDSQGGEHGTLSSKTEPETTNDIEVADKASLETDEFLGGSNNIVNEDPIILNNLPFTIACAECSAVLEKVNSLEAIVISLAQNQAETLAEVRRIRVESTAISTHMNYKEAKEALEKLYVKLPIADDFMMAQVESQEKNPKINEALKSCLYQRTSANKSVRLNFAALIKEMLCPKYMFGKYTMYGTSEKESFQKKCGWIRDIVFSVMSFRHKQIAKTDVKEEFAHYFKYVGQAAKRSEKQQSGVQSD